MVRQSVVFNLLDIHVCLALALALALALVLAFGVSVERVWCV